MTARAKKWVVVALAAAIGAYFLLGQSDESSAVRRALTTGAQAIGAPSAESELARVLSEDVHVEIPGLFVGDGRDRAIRAAMAETRDRHPVITLAHVEVSAVSSTHAAARFDVVISDSQAGDLHADTRRASAELTKTTQGWVVNALSVEPTARAEPEPRP